MSPINIIYNNINSYQNKKHLLHNYVEKNNIGCTLLVETKHKQDTNIQYRNWNTFDFKGNRVTNYARGGSIIQAHPKLAMRKENSPSLNNPLNEAIHTSIPFQDDKLHIFLAYIHPTSRIDENIFIKAALYKYAIIIGDFNVNRTKKKQIDTFINNSNFTQYKTLPTFLMPNNTDSTPDIILYTKNLTNNFKSVELTPDIGSDHLAFKIKFNLQETTNDNDLIKYNFNKCDVEKVNQEMSLFINEVEGQATTYESIKKFNEKLSNSIISNTPTTHSKFYSHELPPYIIKLIKTKRRMYREYQNNPDPLTKTQINDYNKNIHRMIQQYRSHTWLETCTKIKHKQGRNFYQEVKKLSRYKKKSNIPTLEENGRYYTEDVDKANLFAEHFNKAYTEDQDINFNQVHYDAINNWYQNYFNTIPPHNNNTINEDMYFETLYNSKNTAPGFDNISYKIIKQLNYSIHEYIIKIYNFCMANMYFPKEWKAGVLITIPKPNSDHSKAINYRPITLLPALGKIFEKIIKALLEEHISHKIPGYQFGFTTKSSTLHPLTILTSNVQTAKLEGKKSAALFLDINKAFDSVWHMGLLYKLKQLECPDNLIHIIRNFLELRKIKIKINNTFSEQFVPQQGVPQGSPLSPILYNIYCHDIYSYNQPITRFFNKDSYVLQFADDTALISHNTNLQNTIRELQHLITNTETWFNRWRLKPNPLKSQLLIFNHVPIPTSPKVTITNELINPSTTAKYLGVHLDQKLNFNHHTGLMKKRINSRAKHFRVLTYKNNGIDTHTAVKIYKSICRPVLEYGHILYLNSGPRAKKNIEVGERTALRTITKLRHTRNPLHNISNHNLYQKTRLEPIQQRLSRLHYKFSNSQHNIQKIEEFCRIRDPNIRAKFKTPDQTLIEMIRQLEQ